MYSRLLLILVASLQIGCGTVITKIEYGFGRPFSGVDYNIAAITCSNFQTASDPTWGADLPLSMVADALLLPIDLIVEDNGELDSKLVCFNI